VKKKMESEVEIDVPDGIWLDTRSADAVAWVAECAAEYFENGPKITDEDESSFPDLLASVHAAAVAGDIDPTRALEGLATTLQAVCMSATGDLNEFFREVVGQHVVTAMREDASVGPVWSSNVVYPEFLSEPAPNSPDDGVVVEISTEAIHRVGSMLHNLRREPGGVTTRDGEGWLAEEWSIGAALTALLDGPEVDTLSGVDVALLVGLPILAITELFDWLDREVLPGLSRAALNYVRTDMIRNLLDYVDSKCEEAA